MAKSKKNLNSLKVETALASLPDPHRAGLPSRDSIIGVTTSTAGTKYTVFHSDEVDAYEEAAEGPEFAAAAAAALPAGDDYGGKARRAAKLSIAAAKTESFKDVKDLVKSLTADSKMSAHNPPIGTGVTSNRVKEEKRNVHVTGFMYAASREPDNDFHLIIGRNLKATPEMYMTMEISGLPPSGSPSMPQLKSARDAFNAFIKAKAGNKLPGLKYDFYDPPVPVEIDGSLFFDVSHAKGPHPGPPSLKSRMPVIWEVHPITKIVLK